jgi:hypothetical protein
MAQPLLEGKVEHDDRELIISGLRARVRDLEGELQTERLKNVGIDSGVKHLREALTPVYNGLRRIFGEMDGMGISAEPERAASPKASAAWESWKHKLGGKAAEAIDILMVHGELNAVQLRLHLHCGQNYIYKVISQLNVAGLLKKNGGKISLKEL